MPERDREIHRRGFLKIAALAGTGPLFLPDRGDAAPGLREGPLPSPRLAGGLRRDEGPERLARATWLVAERIGAALQYRFPAGSLAGVRFLTADLLLDGRNLAVFQLRLREGEKGPVFRFKFGLLAQCSARLRMPLSLLDLNRWRIDRQGAFLKPTCGGQRVRLDRVDRLTLVLVRKDDRPARWCMTPLVATARDVEPLRSPVLPRGPLLDEVGQSRLHDWPGKSSGAAEVVRRLTEQLEAVGRRRWPEAFSRWGGWKRRKEEGSGFFRTHHDGKRWWLLDPEGHPFWSAGLDCVRIDTDANIAGLETALSWKPDPSGPYRVVYGRGGRSINYLAANLIRAFGPTEWQAKWARVALGELRRLGFNTVGNWSEWSIARPVRFPYVRPMSFSPRRVSNVYRDFPDVYHDDFARDAAEYAETLRETAEDPALIGYFMMNEPTWGFSSELPAAGMLYTTRSSATRRALAGFLRERHSGDEALSKAWGFPVKLAEVAEGAWTRRLSKRALEDLEEFSARMTERFFSTLREATRRVDPNHLNLGIRYAGVPSRWAVRGMRSFDVFSMNNYREKLPADAVRRIHDELRRPVMIGEYHFGALDVGLPASGIGRVRTQADRGRAYRVYLEDAASNPACVGAHWFTLYDESALGRFDGENYNIGFIDVCHRPYPELGTAARRSHERLYEVASGEAPPYAEAPEYLSKLF